MGLNAENHGVTSKKIVKSGLIMGLMGFWGVDQGVRRVYCAALVPWSPGHLAVGDGRARTKKRPANSRPEG